MSATAKSIDAKLDAFDRAQRKTAALVQDIAKRMDALEAQLEEIRKRYTAGQPDEITPQSPAPPDVTAIQKIVTVHLGVSMQSMLSSDRTDPIAWARHLAMYVARQNTPWDTETIGRWFGRDGSTVRHAIRTVRARVENYPAAALTANAIQVAVRQALEAMRPPTPQAA